MTRQRYDEHSTEFGLWLREQEQIESGRGYVTTNLDYVWYNYKTGQWMLLEEKRYGAGLTFPQRKMFGLLDDVASSDVMYLGFYLIVFERTSPNDGGVDLNGSRISACDLLEFLQFKKPDVWYQGLFNKRRGA